MEVVGNLTFYRKVFDFFAKQNKIKKSEKLPVNDAIISKLFDKSIEIDMPR